MLVNLKDHLKTNRIRVTKENLFHNKQYLINDICGDDIKEGYIHRLSKDAKLDTFLFENNDYIIGCCLLRLIQKTKKERKYVITLIGIKNELRGNGLGSKLFELLIGYLKQYSQKKIIFIHSLQERTSFYERLGFIETMEYCDMLYNYEDIDDNDIIMKYEIND